MRIRIEREREKKNKGTEGNEAKKWWKSEMENKNYTFVVQNGKHIYTDRPMKAAIFFYFYYYFHGCSGCWLKIPKPIILLVLFVVVVRHHRLLPYIFFSFNLVFFFISFCFDSVDVKIPFRPYTFEFFFVFTFGSIFFFFLFGTNKRKK